MKVILTAVALLFGAAETVKAGKSVDCEDVVEFYQSATPLFNMVAELAKWCANTGSGETTCKEYVRLMQQNDIQKHLNIMVIQTVNIGLQCPEAK
ncbi:hypothetical protein PhaeoP83_01679 [Phaeobacter inhibens]|uniref:Uncharacterized protein n=1 Tax=Phaeobacter inhibens TaxID=221822 RepID=A0ABN5GLQ9_9RHOB|nr:hypothetical protein [Phaeobacter inhibens]AUQ49953.1 hypothetical protein PhaeoP83_01679 [Phaeobacter inhibens]AUQ94509.1 hypothetical protein PhaeoP66_01727 [Phaeobacter inhibens]AUR19758.1 hypothetical protein PhaeoP80_01679 [Phaeobacter inhibens]